MKITQEIKDQNDNLGRKVTFIFILIISVLLSGCKFGSSYDSEGRNNTGSIQLDIQGFQSLGELRSASTTYARTLEPDSDLIVDSFRVVAVASFGKVIETTFPAGSSVQLTSVEMGDWNIVVEALNAEGYLFARGSLDVTVVPEQNLQQTVVLSPLEDAGSFMLTVLVPESMSATPHLVGRLKSQALPDIPLTFTIESGASGFTTHIAQLDNTVPAGYYTLSVSVFDDQLAVYNPSRYTGFAEAVRIMEGLTTTGSYTMNDAPGMEVTLDIEFDFKEAIAVSIENAATLPTSFAYDSTTTFALVAEVPVTDPDLGSLTYEWYVNGLLVSEDAQYDISSVGRLPTSTVTKTKTTPTLDIRSLIAGTSPILGSTATDLNSVVGDFASAPNGGQDAKIYFDIILTPATGTQRFYAINISEAELAALPVANMNAVTVGEINTLIQQQIASSPFPNQYYLSADTQSNLQIIDTTGDNGGKIELIQNTGLSNIFGLSDLGFATDNRIAQGVNDIFGNNSFILNVIGPFNQYTIILPTGIYDSVESLAAAIRDRLAEDYNVLEDVLRVVAWDDKLAFINSDLGSAYGVEFFPDWTVPSGQSNSTLTQLGLDDLEIEVGLDEDSSSPRYLPGIYSVDLVAKSLDGMRRGSTTFSFEVTGN